MAAKSQHDELTELPSTKRRKFIDSKEQKAKQGKKDDDKKEAEKKKRMGKGKEDGEMTKRKGKSKEKEKKVITEEKKSDVKKQSEDIGEEEKYEALVIVPPDGGWGWVVVASSFLILICCDGILNSYGAFSHFIEEEFHIRLAETSIISSIASCLYYVCGPVWGALGNRYGFRPLIIIGSGIMALANLTAFFVKNAFAPFAAFYAVGSGTGGGMVFLSIYVMVGVYFERWRGYATCIVSCGSSLGTVFMPTAYNAITEYGWRFVLVLNCVLLSCCMFLGILIRPLKPTLVTTRPEPKQVQFKEKRKFAEKKVKGKASVPTPLSKGPELTQTASFVTLKGVGVGTATGSATSVYISAQEGRPSPSPPTEEELEGSGARPMYRDDIFYPASAARLGSQSTYRLSGFSLMRLPTLVDLERVDHKRCPCLHACRPTCTCCPAGMRRVLATLLDTSLLRSPVFLGIAMSQTICILGYHAPFLFAYARAKDAGMDEVHSAWLIPLMGIANTIGRLLCGVIVELPGVSALHLTGVSFAIGGLFSIASCFDMGYRLQFTFVVVFGLMAAAFMAMKSIILVDYLGIERLTNAFGLLLMFQGFACLCGPPLAGFIADVSGYNSAFFFAGTMAFVGGISGCIIIPLRKYEVKKGMRDR